MLSEYGKAMNAIAEERKRQVGEEGWTEAHDDQHEYGELAAAAEGYLASAISRADGQDITSPPEAWPFDPSWWKPKGYYHDLKRAAALIAAEMERVERLSEKQACECLACGEPLYDGDPYYPDYNNGSQLHAYCCGPELEGFTDGDGNPLPPGSAIPEPSRFEVRP
jgi:hypothetical protein